MSSTNGSVLGDTISNWDTSKLGRLSYESPEVRDRTVADRLVPLRGGDDIGGIRGDMDSVDDMLGRCRMEELRLSPMPCCDCLLEVLVGGTAWLVYWSGNAGLGGISTSVGEEDTTEPRRIDALSTTLGLRFRVGFSPLSCSLLERGVVADDPGLVGGPWADRLPDADRHDLNIDLRILLRSGRASGTGGIGGGDIEGAVGVDGEG